MNLVVVVPRPMNRNDAVITSSAVSRMGALTAARTSLGRYSPDFMTPRPRKKRPVISRASAMSVAMLVPPRSGSTTV